MQTRDALDLSPADILARCKDLVPVNTIVEKAIAAHRIAFEHYSKKDRSAADWQEAHTLAMYTLRAVILARTPDASDCQQQIVAREDPTARSYAAGIAASWELDLFGGQAAARDLIALKWWPVFVSMCKNFKSSGSSLTKEEFHA